MLYSLSKHAARSRAKREILELRDALIETGILV